MPGKAVCPFHSHWTQWELFLFLSGEGTVRHGTRTRTVRAGEAVMHPPHEAHQLINSGSTPLEYLLVANNPATDIYHYPDSNKWGFRPHGGFFLRTDVDYFRGEDTVPPETAFERAPDPCPGDGSRARFVRVADIPENEIRSTTGKYHSFARDISLRLGGIRDTGPWAGGHPFDVQERRVPPGARVCPCHAHSLQWEFFLILSGRATVRANDIFTEVGSGMAFIQPPGTAHQIHNTGNEDLRFLVIADNVPAELITYPDSGKCLIKPERKVFRMVETDYYDGEE